MKHETYILRSLILLTTAAVLSGCAVSEAKVVDDAAGTLESKLTKKPAEPSYEDDKAAFYVPERMEIEQIDDYNYMLTDDGQVHLMFLNDIEHYSDTAELTDILLTDEEPLVTELLETDGQQGYITVSSFDEDNYKVVTGVDGVKLTSVMPISEVPERTKEMLEIVSSVQTDK